MPLNILICGGGIAGPSLAFFLFRLGHTITIVERWPTLRAHGAQIDLRAQGLVIAARMGLLDTIRTKTVQEDGLEILDEHSNSVAKFLVNRSGKGAQGLISEFEIMRGELVRVLYDSTYERENVKYVFGKTVESFEQDEEKVLVRFSDGTSGQYDILVGADGQGSRIRKTILPQDEDPLTHLGIYLAHWNIPSNATLPRFGRATHFNHGRTVWTRYHNGQAAFQLRDADPALRSLTRLPLEEQMKLWTNRFADTGPLGAQLAKEMPHSAYFYSSESVQVKTSTFSSGRVVVLGDAASAVGATGMGTTNALVGAYVLAGQISRISSSSFSSPSSSAQHSVSLPRITQAFREYERVMRPFSTELQKTWPGVFRFAMPDTWIGVWLLRFVVKWFARLRLSSLVASFGKEDDGKTDWQVPIYEELKLEKIS